MKKILIFIVLIAAVAGIVKYVGTDDESVSQEPAVPIQTEVIDQSESPDTIADTPEHDQEVILEFDDETPAVRESKATPVAETSNTDSDEDDAMVERKMTTEMDRRTVGNENKALDNEYREYRDGTFTDEMSKTEEQQATDTLSLKDEAITRKVQPSSEAAKKTESDYENFQNVFDSEF